MVLPSLENEEIYVSSGSGCSSHSKEPSYDLKGIGTDSNMIDGSIRFGMSEVNTREDSDATLDALEGIVARIRKLNMR